MARTVFRHRLFDVELFEVTTPAGEAEFVRMRMPDWCQVAAITEDGDVVFVRQRRFGVDEDTLEVPGGMVDEGEPASDGVMRELREETGYGGGTLVPLGWVYPNPALQDNRVFMFAALGVQRVGEPEPDPDEDLEVVMLPLRDLEATIDAGQITHALVYNTCLRLLLRRDHPEFATYFDRSEARSG